MKVKKFKKIEWHKLENQPGNLPVDDDLYRTANDIIFHFTGTWKKQTARFSLFVPKGFLNDGQSVPKFFRWYMRPDGLARAAAIAHDACYRTKGFTKNFELKSTLTATFAGQQEPAILSQKASDQIYKACYLAWCKPLDWEERRESEKKARFGYRILRAFGWIKFGKPIKKGRL